jgi:hypothetical protein
MVDKSFINNLRTSVRPLAFVSELSEAALSVGINPNDRLMNSMLSENVWINIDAINP